MTSRKKQLPSTSTVYAFKYVDTTRNSWDIFRKKFKFSLQPLPSVPGMEQAASRSSPLCFHVPKFMPGKHASASRGCEQTQHFKKWTALKFSGLDVNRNYTRATMQTAPQLWVKFVEEQYLSTQDMEWVINDPLFFTVISHAYIHVSILLQINT